MLHLPAAPRQRCTTLRQRSCLVQVYVAGRPVKVAAISGGSYLHYLCLAQNAQKGHTPPDLKRPRDPCNRTSDIALVYWALPPSLPFLSPDPSRVLLQPRRAGSAWRAAAAPRPAWLPCCARSARWRQAWPSSMTSPSSTGTSQVGASSLDRRHLYRCLLCTPDRCDRSTVVSIGLPGVRWNKGAIPAQGMRRIRQAMVPLRLPLSEPLSVGRPGMGSCVSQPAPPLVRRLLGPCFRPGTRAPRLPSPR